MCLLGWKRAKHTFAVDESPQIEILKMNLCEENGIFLLLSINIHCLISGKAY